MKKFIALALFALLGVAGFAYAAVGDGSTHETFNIPVGGTTTLADGSVATWSGTVGVDVAVPLPTTTTPPPFPAVGNRLSMIGTAPARQAPTANDVLPPQYGTATVAAGALGTILAISPFGYAPYGITNWVQVQFDPPCNAAIPNCIAWVGSDNIQPIPVTQPPPPGG